MDSHARSAIKAVSWRVLALLITFSVSWILTRQFELAATIGAVDSLIKIVTYYGHERIWNRIKFGQIKLLDLDYEI